MTLLRAAPSTRVAGTEMRERKPSASHWCVPSVGAVWEPDRRPTTPQTHPAIGADAQSRKNPRLERRGEFASKG